MNNFKTILFHCCLISALQASSEITSPVDLKDGKIKSTKSTTIKQPKIRIKSKVNEKPLSVTFIKTSKKIGIGLVIGAYVHHVLNNSQDFTQPDFSIGTLRKDQERFKATAMNTCYSLKKHQEFAAIALNNFMKNDKNQKEKNSAKELETTDVPPKMIKAIDSATPLDMSEYKFPDTHSKTSNYDPDTPDHN